MFWLGLRLLLLLAAANIAPIAAKRCLGPRSMMPLDGGLRFVAVSALRAASTATTCSRSRSRTYGWREDS